MIADRDDDLTHPDLTHRSSWLCWDGFDRATADLWMIGSVFSFVKNVLNVTISKIVLPRLVVAIICGEIGDLAGLPLLI
jgi:hypothetical protein